jgi:hypothetical protein
VFVLAALAVPFTSAAAADAPRSRYIVRFAEPALGRYNAVAAAAARSDRIPLARRANGRLRLDVDGAAAHGYLDWLHERQQQHVVDIEAAIGRSATPAKTLRHALDAAILTLTADEAARIARTSGVASVDAVVTFAPQSDLGPGFTGASSLWWGTTSGSGAIFASSYDANAFRGDGVVVGVIDTGYNSLSPSFQAADLADWRATNPFGHGVFHGQCRVSGISLGGCNDKVIGVWDELGLVVGAGTYSVEDEVGHGSHTASTAAGSVRTASLAGYATTISGVAPHANLMIFRACSADSCDTDAIVAAIDDAVAEGVVDVLNFSIGDRMWPWNDPVAEAFLSATEAGIFVAAAAGNGSAPGAGSVHSMAPWVTTAGAGSHGGGAIVAGRRTAMQPDMLAPYSLLGPALYTVVSPAIGIDVIKPELQVPGFHNLAAQANDGSMDGAQRVGMMDGTSAAAAHLSGSAALLLGAHPDWTPLEAKSALMMSAKESGLTRPDGTTPSGYFDRGAGRVQEFAATRAGLVLDESAARLAAADPARGGDPSSLNLAGMQQSHCISACTFTRTFRSTQNHTVTWTISVANGPSPAFSSLSVSPRKFTLGAHATSPAIVISANSSRLPADGVFRFARIVLTPDDANLAALHLPVAVAVPR